MTDFPRLPGHSFPGTYATWGSGGRDTHRTSPGVTHFHVVTKSPQQKPPISTANTRPSSPPTAATRDKVWALQPQGHKTPHPRTAWLGGWCEIQIPGIWGAGTLAPRPTAPGGHCPRGEPQGLTVTPARLMAAQSLALGPSGAPGRCGPRGSHWDPAHPPGGLLTPDCPPPSRARAASLAARLRPQTAHLPWGPRTSGQGLSVALGRAPGHGLDAQGSLGLHGIGQSQTHAGDAGGRRQPYLLPRTSMGWGRWRSGSRDQHPDVPGCPGRGPGGM